MRTWLTGRQAWRSALATGGGLFVLSGCDPNVRDTVLSGVEAATTGLFSTFVAAFFESLEEPEEVPATVSTFIDVAEQIFA